MPLEPDRVRVLARSSTWKYKRADRDIGRLRRELGADYVLEGSLRRAGERVRVTAQLVRVDDQSQVWAETYERPFRDVLILHSEVAETVARTIAVTLTPHAQARLARARPVRAEAYQDYLREGIPARPRAGSQLHRRTSLVLTLRIRPYQIWLRGRDLKSL